MMSAGMSTFVITAIWALPIMIAVFLMAIYYRSPTEDELRRFDELQPDEKPPTPEQLTRNGKS